MHRKLSAHIGILFLANSFALVAWAQIPSAQEMIEKLKATPAAQSIANIPDAAMPKTRSLGAVRTLVVDRATTQEAAVATGTVISGTPEKPSLSLLIQFDFDSARVRLESQQALANLAEALKSNELIAARFAIEGHTDAQGKADYNQRLSQHRAEAVRLYLISKGVEGARLAAAGKGATEPANKDDPMAAENRRVKIVNQL